MRVQGDIIVKGKGEAITAGNLFSVMRETERAQYYGKFDDDTCVETVGHVQDNYLSSKGGRGDGDYDFENCLIRVKGDLFVKDKDQSINGSNVFEIRRQDQQVLYLGPKENIKGQHVATAEWVADQLGEDNSFIPGNQVAAMGDTAVGLEQGGFYEDRGGNLFYRGKQWS